MEAHTQVTHILRLKKIEVNFVVCTHLYRGKVVESLICNLYHLSVRFSERFLIFFV